VGYDDPVPGDEPTELDAIKAYAPELFAAEPEELA